jgi:hypothetical protein
MRFLGLLIAVVLSLPTWAAFRGAQDTTDLGLYSKIKCSTGMTCSRSGSYFLMTASPSLTSALNLAGAEATDAQLYLKADESDDNGDDWLLSSVASGNALTFSNDTSGSQVAKLSLSTAGVMTLADSETITNASDAISLGFDDAAARVNVVAFEATNAAIFLQADESDDNGDDWKMESVASDNTFVIANDTSGSQVAKLTMAASDGDITLTGGITGDGGDTLSGFLKKQVAITTTSITAAQCGSTFVGDSADVIALPEASTVLGCRLTFVAGTADDVDINPADGTDQIGPISVDGAAITPAAGDAIRMTDIGTSVTLEAVGANLWVAVSHNGPITDVN